MSVVDGAPGYTGLRRRREPYHPLLILAAIPVVVLMLLFLSVIVGLM
jgi:hypothetical protein